MSSEGGRGGSVCVCERERERERERENVLGARILGLWNVKGGL